MIMNNTKKLYKYILSLTKDDVSSIDREYFDVTASVYNLGINQGYIKCYFFPLTKTIECEIRTENGRLQVPRSNEKLNNFIKGLCEESFKFKKDNHEDEQAIRILNDMEALKKLRAIKL